MKQTNLHKFLVIVSGLLLFSIFAVSNPAAAATIDDADQGGRPLFTSLSGAEQVPVAGDPDGSGTALITLNLGKSTICYELTVQNISPATAAHIHVAPAGSAGPVAVPLAPPTSGYSSGCITVESSLIMDMLLNPSGYYVNIHNADYPAGALRGQLGK